ncbi:hypothetical protein ISG33_10815 [Glaciecola sp. MH2013]|uniref:hypothetical protein n=1 Tax=Glaciecola sp. MH2013 TaxID=2785524 RepID=UPI00189FA357|nr:hypothetical protein [Glaciecola sp. MH2013]MBF7073891.1 hypothetical protein [Glaciecola sp. MH2013]
MIDSISGSASFRPPPPPKNSSSSELSSEQSEFIEKTLSSYDANKLTEQDASDIVNSFAEAGIKPSAGFADLLAESGFDARELGDLAGVGGAREQRPPPQSSASNLSSVVDYLDGLSDTSSSETSGSLAETLSQKFGLPEGQSLLSIYT